MIEFVLKRTQQTSGLRQILPGLHMLYIRVFYASLTPYALKMTDNVLTVDLHSRQETGCSGQ